LDALFVAAQGVINVIVGIFGGDALFFLLQGMSLRAFRFLRDNLKVIFSFFTVA